MYSIGMAVIRKKRLANREEGMGDKYIYMERKGSHFLDLRLRFTLRNKMGLYEMDPKKSFKN